MPFQPQPDPKTDCLICRRRNIEFNTSVGYEVSVCPRCGVWMPLYPREPGPKSRLHDWLDDQDAKVDARRRSRLSHLVRQQQRPVWTIIGVPIERLGEWDVDKPLPSPAEQADNLILWIGDHQDDFSQPVGIDSNNVSEVAAWVGAPLADDDHNTVFWLLDRVSERLVERVAMTSFALTLAGWERREALRRTVRENRRAFLAMAFRDELKSVVADCFKPAVAAAGFTLESMLDNPTAGQIDDQMRVAMRTSRFVVADLTHGNQGAYWEAGFAEGLGRPVIYTCRKAEWEAQKVHFDTNHLSTIVWDPANLPDAAARLTAMIRATLPTEAKMD